MRTTLAVLLLALGVIGLSFPLGFRSEPPHARAPSRVQTATMMRQQAGCFVPNLGQWEHRARFVHRSGPMTLFLEDRGWVLDLVERPARHKAGPMHRKTPRDGEIDQKMRGVTLRMTFEGDAHVPEIVGEGKWPGHHNYFLGNDESRWRTGVPVYGSIRYEDLYPGIDLRLHETNGVPEYDLLLQPGTDVSLVVVHVDGAKDLSIAEDGSLVIETALGPVRQSKPKTWQVNRDGGKCEMVCNFTLLGRDRFGFVAPDWGGDTSLTIDPGLIWSTSLGGSGHDYAYALSVDASGVVTVAGDTLSPNFPTTSGAYDTTFNGGPYLFSAFVSRLDPRKSGSAQLVYSTFLGSGAAVKALSVDTSGVVTVTGITSSATFPTTSGAYDTTYNASGMYAVDTFVSRLDPTKGGSAQLVYSTFLGGDNSDYVSALSVDASDLVTVAGDTASTNFPTTSGAYQTTNHGGGYNDAFVSRLDLSKTGSAQLTYSTCLGGSSWDYANALSVDANGAVTVAGWTLSTDFPTTSGAFDTTYEEGQDFKGGFDAFVSRLDPSKSGSGQLVYSTYLGGNGEDRARALSVDASGVVTIVGDTGAWPSNNFPTTSGAYDTSDNKSVDAFVSRLDPRKSGSAQLVYSTFLGGTGGQVAYALFVDAGGVVTVAGITLSTDFPTTSSAYDTTYNGGGTYSGDVFVSRLDPSKSGSAQLVYSTFLGGSDDDYANALFVDASGMVTVAGSTSSLNFPTTLGAFDTTMTGSSGAFVSRLNMGVALYADVHEVSISTGGAQNLTVNAGKAQANKSYWIFGSVTGTTPGVTLGSAIGPVHIPLHPDIWTDYTFALANNGVLTNTKGVLDASGQAQAAFNVRKFNQPGAIGLVFHHAYLVYDAQNNFYMASNPVPLKLVR